jgi:hypothetical protein
MMGPKAGSAMMISLPEGIPQAFTGSGDSQSVHAIAATAFSVIDLLGEHQHLRREADASVAAGDMA